MVSKRVERKTEKYLRAHGCEPIHLNDKQWEMVVSEVQRIRHCWCAVLVIASCAVVVAALSVYRFANTQQKIDSLASKDIIFYAVVAEDYENMISPTELRNHVDKLSEQSFYIGIFFTLPIFLMASIMIPIMHNKERKKVVEIFLKAIKESEDKSGHAE